MGKRKKPGKDLLSEFLRKAAERGMTYAQAQVEETCELIRKGRLGQRGGKPLFVCFKQG